MYISFSTVFRSAYYWIVVPPTTLKLHPKLPNIVDSIKNQLFYPAEATEVHFANS